MLCIFPVPKVLNGFKYVAIKKLEGEKGKHKRK